MLREERLGAIVPWQEVMSESEVLVLCRYHAAYDADCWRVLFLIVVGDGFYVVFALCRRDLYEDFKYRAELMNTIQLLTRST